ncbi:MAG: FliG C-terminal domain-containing protein [Bacteriovoracia bacterium]
MSIYARYKKSADGFRQLVELLEAAPKAKRDKMIEVGMQEDPDYTYKALEFVIHWEDILKLNELELAELVSAAPANFLAHAFSAASNEIKDTVLRCAKPPKNGEIKDFFESEISKAQIGVAQLKIITIMRDLERKGKIHTKRIPT